MTKVEQSAQEHFLTFRNRLCEMLSEIEEEIKTAYVHGYSECETDEKFRTKPIVTSALEAENAQLKKDLEELTFTNDYQKVISSKNEQISFLEAQLTEAKELIEKYRQAVNKCLHITFMGGGCEVNTIGQYATLVDGYLTDVEGLSKWKN